MVIDRADYADDVPFAVAIYRAIRLKGKAEIIWRNAPRRVISEIVDQAVRGACSETIDRLLNEFYGFNMTPNSPRFETDERITLKPGDGVLLGGFEGTVIASDVAPSATIEMYPKPKPSDS